MSNELMKLIDDYAEWSAQSYWEDDQGYGEYVEIARANMESARKAVVDVVATLQAENERMEKQIADAGLWAPIERSKLKVVIKGGQHEDA